MSEILTDGVHLACADLEELHRFARRIGLKRQWFQRGHYDLTTRRARERAIEAGAVRMSTRELVKAIREGDDGDD